MPNAPTLIVIAELDVAFAAPARTRLEARAVIDCWGETNAARQDLERLPIRWETP